VTNKSCKSGVVSSVFSVLVLTFSLATSLLAQNTAQRTFSTPQEAVDALIAANRVNDVNALDQILGPEATSLISSGDDTQDKNDRAHFVELYDVQHHMVPAGVRRRFLVVGSNAWELPIPVVLSNGTWRFDSGEGVHELQARRIGANELAAIDVCRALRKAQTDYAAAGHDGNPPGLFAQRFRSTPGKHDGLYWTVAEGEPQSPAGPLVADAEAEGYAQGRRQPFHGYYFRILRAQGSHAPGGAMDYVNGGRMNRGFAILAFPAEYGASGVMTFIVGRGGRVFQSDLGQSTTDAARGINAFDPGPSWRMVSLAP